ncbi:MAG: hypothetical protein QM758_20885 [Armatimonas sp.]
MMDTDKSEGEWLTAKEAEERLRQLRVWVTAAEILAAGRKKKVLPRKSGKVYKVRNGGERHEFTHFNLTNLLSYFRPVDDPKPRGIYSGKYAERLKNDTNLKAIVASYIVQTFLNPNTGNKDSILNGEEWLLLDGTSTLFLSCAIFSLPNGLFPEIFTPNLAVALEGALRNRTKICNMVPGDVDYLHYSVHGKETELWIAREVENKIAVVPVSEISSQGGIAANDRWASALKRMCLERAKRVLVIADSSKLTVGRAKSTPIYKSTVTWERILEERGDSIECICDDRFRMSDKAEEKESFLKQMFPNLHIVPASTIPRTIKNINRSLIATNSP